jgi:hypothetical protein
VIDLARAALRLRAQFPAAAVAASVMEGRKEMQFTEWIKAQADREDEIGALGRAFAAGQEIDVTVDAARDALRAAHREFATVGA